MEKVQLKTSKALREWLVKNNHCPSVAEDADEETLNNVFGKGAARLLVSGQLSTEKYEELMIGEKTMSRSPSAEKMFAQHIRVRDESEKYSDKRFVGRHIKTGGEIHNPFTGQATEIPSERDNAKAGVFLKHLAKKSGLFNGVMLSENEKSLLDEMTQNDPWAGSVGGQYEDYIPGGGRIKQLIDDSSSGGVEVTPIQFDDQIITFPLLSGELFPRVDLRQIDKGRRIMGGSLANPTISWGQGDASECPLFDTTGMVGAVDHTIFGCAVAVEVGRDFLQDSGADVGATLVANIGSRMQSELDKMIAVGDGTMQPEGIFTATGISTITTDNGAGGAQTLNDYSALMFGIGKQYRNQAYNPCYISNDTTYARSRQIRVDPHVIANTVNQTPVISDVNSFSNYQSLGWPHAIENDIPNARAAFGCLKKYRLFRRLGMEVQWVQGGLELAQKNLVLLVVRARYAGRVVDAGAFCKWTTGQA